MSVISNFLRQVQVTQEELTNDYKDVLNNQIASLVAYQVGQLPVAVPLKDLQKWTNPANFATWLESESFIIKKTPQELIIDIPKKDSEDYKDSGNFQSFRDK